MGLEGDLRRFGISERTGKIYMRKHVIFSAGLSVSFGRGKTFFVDSVNGSDNNGGQSPFQALATLDAAVGKCTATQGDTIVALPGHVENIASATSLVCDIAGIHIVGLGVGSMRPTLTYTAAAGSIVVSAADVVFENIIFVAGFADVLEAFTPSAVGLTLIDCKFADSAANLNFIELVDTGTTNNQCDDLAFVGCEWVSPDALITSMLKIDADLDGLTVINCYVNIGVNTNDLPIVAVVATGKDVTNIHIVGNTFIRLNDANELLFTMDTTTANTGVIARNYVRHLDTGTELLITAASNIAHFENYTTAVVDLSGVIMPARDA